MLLKFFAANKIQRNVGKNLCVVKARKYSMSTEIKIIRELLSAK